LRAHGT